MRLALVFLLAVLICGCKQPQTETPSTNQAAEVATPSPSASPTPPRPAGDIEFTDVTADAGIRFKHNSGAFGKKYLPETIGSGGAFLDYDNDGWQDVILINSMDWPENKKRRSFPALYHNNKDGSFTDVTQKAGVAANGNRAFPAGTITSHHERKERLDLRSKRSRFSGETDQTRRRLGGRQPLCGTGVTSRIKVTLKPAV